MGQGKSGVENEVKKQQNQGGATGNRTELTILMLDRCAVRETLEARRVTKGDTHTNKQTERQRSTEEHKEKGNTRKYKENQ